MRRLVFIALLCALTVNGKSWTCYEDFEIDATNAMRQLNILMSQDYTNQLGVCMRGQPSTNEVSTAALLMLIISDDAKSERLSDFIGDTNSLVRASSLLAVPTTQRNLWQKSCAIAMLATNGSDPVMSRIHFNSATNILAQWDSTSNIYDGGILYQSIAQHFGVRELTPRKSIIFAAAQSAKSAGMDNEYNYYKGMLPLETQLFLED